LPETEVAEQAYRFAEQIEPAFVFAHSVRSYLYARELAGRGSSRDYDDELLFLSCVRHDIGLTDQGNREPRFEVDGADSASEFLRERGADERRARIVWLAVALHTSDGIASRMVRRSRWPRLASWPTSLAWAARNSPPTWSTGAHAAFPRDDLGFALAAAIVAQATAKPNKATPTSLPGQLVRWHQPIGTLPDWYDLVSAAGWGDRPAARQEGTATTPDQLGPLFTRYLAAGDLATLVPLYEPAATLRPEPGRVVSGRCAASTLAARCRYPSGAGSIR
jgi:HD domain